MQIYASNNLYSQLDYEKSHAKKLQNFPSWVNTVPPPPPSMTLEYYIFALVINPYPLSLPTQFVFDVLLVGDAWCICKKVHASEFPNKGWLDISSNSWWHTKKIFLWFDNYCPPPILGFGGSSFSRFIRVFMKSADFFCMFLDPQHLKIILIF